jgi:hypothetical protein
MPIKRYNGTSWDVVAGDGSQGATGETGTSALTTKGDLLAYSTTPARLGVGTDGSVLQADSSASTGLSWATPAASLANPVIGGGMDIWQRGTSFTPTAAYTADRWYYSRYGGVGGTTISRQTTNDTTNLPNIQYCMRIQRNSGDTSTNSLQLASSIETINSIPFAGKTVTVSFYARAGSNFSATSNQITMNLYSGTGTDQNYLSTWTGSATPAAVTPTLTTTWQRFVATGTVASTATELSVYFVTFPTGTAGTNDYFEVTGVQIDLGTYTATTAPTFRRSGGTLQGELAACMRYYEKSYAQGTTPGTNSDGMIGGMFSTAVGTDNNNYYMNYFAFKVVKRSSPTLTIYDSAGNTGKATAMSLSSAQTNNITAVSSNIVDSGARVYVGQLDGKAGFIFHYQANAEL